MNLRGAFYWCDNRCSDKALGSMQIASMVIEEGGEGRTINLCKRCYNEKLVQQGKRSLKSKVWRKVVERKAHRGRLWKIFGSEQVLRGMWEYFTCKRAWARYQQMSLSKNRKEYKVSGNKNLLSKKIWSKTNEMLRQIAMPKKCAVRTMQRSRAIGKVSKRNPGKKESSVNGPLRGFKRLVTRFSRRTSAAKASHRKF